MIQEIKYAGYSALPSDYECQDGDLALSLNLLNENGSLGPVSMPEVGFTLPAGAKVLCIHTVGTARNFILLTQNAPDSALITVLPNDGSGTAQSFTIADEVLSATAIGNLLLFTGRSSLHYVYCKDGTYSLLGDSLPELNIEFGLRGSLASSKYDGALEFIKGDEAIENTGWESFANVNLEGKPVPADDWSAPFSFPEEAALALDQEYKLECFLPYKDMKMSGCKVRLYGKPSPEAEPLMIEHHDFFSSGDGIYKFKSTGNYSGLYITVRPYFRNWADGGEIEQPAMTVPSGAVSLSRGSFAVGDASPSEVIKYTADSCNALGAAVNSFIATEATGKNRFIYPFFARAAFRLFDGNVAAVTAPCLLIPNSDYVPYIFYRKKKKPDLGVCAFTASLGWRILSEIPPAWRDIISAIEIYVSQPVWPYDQGANYDPAKRLIEYVPFDSDSLASYGVMTSGDSLDFVPRKLYDACVAGFPTGAYSPHLIRFAARSASDKRDSMENAAQFYLFHTIPMTDAGIPASDPGTLVRNFDFPQIKVGTLASLVSRTPLPDEVLPYRTFAGADLFRYNRRTALFNASYRLPEPSDPTRLAGAFDEVYGQSEFRVSVSVATDDGDKTVISREYRADLSLIRHLPWFFYPDSRARRAEIFIKVRQSALPWSSGMSRRYKITIPLKEHPLLNGAYWICPDDENRPTSVSVSSFVLPTDNSFVSAPSSIYLSETSNPFCYRASLVSSIPAARIDALSTAARPLSTGQFGAFPLYAFTSDGIFAMEISSTGAIVARQPITRDILLPGASPLQIDSAVIFSTDRGIMLLSGSETICVSDPINTQSPFDLLTLPGMTDLHSMTGHGDDSCLPLAPFPDFLSNCGMLYDYNHQRIIVFNPAFSYAYLYSLKSKLWGMTYSEIRYGLDAYPRALAVDRDNRLLDFSTTDGNLIPGLLVTRPIKLEAPDVLKTVDTVIQRGAFRRGHVRSALYGSRDLSDWHLLWSSQDHFLRGFSGTPYKYFRIALLCDLDRDESISGTTMQFRPRETNRPR